MPDLEDRLRDLTSLTGSTRRPMPAAEIDERASRVRHTQRIRVVLPLVALVLAVLLVTTVAATRDGSVVDVGPAATDPAPAAGAGVIAPLRAANDLRTALADEMVDIAASPAGAGPPPANRADIRAATDAAVARLRQAAAASGLDSAGVVEARKGLDTRLNQLVVTRKSIDQRQTELNESVGQYATTLRELARYERAVADLIDDLPTYKAVRAYGLSTEVVQAGTELLALGGVAVGAGGFHTGGPAPSPWDACGEDAAGAGASCPPYQAVVAASETFGLTLQNLLQASPVDVPVEVSTEYRARATIAGVDAMTKRVIEGGVGRNDLSELSIDEYLALAHRQVGAWGAFQRSLLERI